MIDKRGMDQSAPEEYGFSPDRLDRIDSHMQNYVDNFRLAGVLTLVARENKVVHLGLTGLRDMATEEPMAVDTIFRIYSMTKPITSVALLQLHEEGSLRLTDPVTKYLPEFERVRVWAGGKELVSPDRPMTVHDLLRHTAGLSYGGYKDSEHPVDKLYDEADLFNLQLSLEESMSRLSELPLINHPGQAWRYSIATDVIGRLIEVVAGESLESVFYQRIFEPLGMIDTAFSVPPEKMERLATLYGRSRATATGLKPLDESVGGDYRSPRLHLGGQGLVSTISDYLQFARMMLNNGEWCGSRVLEKETAELMTSNQLSPAQLPISYNGIVNDPVPGIGFGLGFSVLLDPDQAGVNGSTGDYGWGGFAETYFWIDPVERITAIMMAQFMPSLTYPIRNEFRTLVHEALES